MESARPPDAPAPATATDAPPNDAPQTTTKTITQYIDWPKNARRTLYRALPTKEAREAYLRRFRKRHGVKAIKIQVTVPVSTQQNAPDAAAKAKKSGKPAWKKGSGTFAWPKGMNRDEFFAKKPGKGRVAYLATYMRKNDIVELEEKPAHVRVRTRRQVEPLFHPRCGCSSSEACAACSRCVELHCVCGLSGRRRRALCQESRACSCSLTDPTTRCKLCHGCRQPHGFSHCRCVLHQRFWWIKRHPESGVELTEEEKKNVCNCFMLAHRHGGAADTEEREAQALKETERVRRLKRATGFASSDNIYRSKKVTSFLGDEGLEIDLDDGVDEGPGSEVLPPTTESVLPRTLTRRMLDPEYNPASYHPLYRSDGCTLLETIEPRGGRVSRRGSAAFRSGALQEEIRRGLDNISYELDRHATMPPDDMVEFLVYMASIKSSNIKELIGTFEDSAAVAASIVIEEYMTQLIEDSAVQQQTLCPPTEEVVQAFTRKLLVGFNWRIFLQRHPCVSPESTALMDKEERLKDELETIILGEFVSMQPIHFELKVYGEDLSKWIRNAIVIPIEVLTGEARCPTNTGTEDSTQHIRLSLKANPINGDPVYKLRFATTSHDGHRVETTVGGLDSKIKANATISQLSRVVKRQDKRSKRRSTPRLYPNNRDDDIVPAEWDHVNAYEQRNLKASCDAYYNKTAPGWGPPSQECEMKHQATESPAREIKKRKLSSP